VVVVVVVEELEAAGAEESAGAISLGALEAAGVVSVVVVVVELSVDDEAEVSAGLLQAERLSAAAPAARVRRSVFRCGVISFPLSIAAPETRQRDQRPTARPVPRRTRHLAPNRLEHAFPRCNAALEARVYAGADAVL
jgi:hypothetical protein